jgi:hypothetical protein
VSDGAAEGALLGALGVDVDPLIVTRGLGEAVDALLVDLEPLARAEVLPHGLLELEGALEYARHAAS